MISFRFATPEEWKDLELPTEEGWFCTFVTDGDIDFPVAVYPVLDKADNLNSYLQLFLMKGLLQPEWASPETKARKLMHRGLNEFIFSSFDTIIIDDKKTGRGYAFSKGKVKEKSKGFG